MSSQNAFIKAIGPVWNYEIYTIEQNPITLGTLTTGLMLLLCGLYFSKVISRKLSAKVLIRLGMDKGNMATIESLSYYFFLVFFTMIALNLAGLPLTIFTVFGGAFAIGVGFGSQNIINNFISGIILMIERPIKVGDFIELNENLVQVDRIGMRSTTIKAFGNKHIIVPNSTFLNKEVINWTHDDDYIRISLKVGVAYGSDVDQVEAILIESLKDFSGALAHRKPLVIFDNFGESSLDFQLYFWIQLKDILDQRMILSGLRFKVYELFKENSIVIAFPQRDLHLHSNGPLPVELFSVGSKGELSSASFNSPKV